MADEVVAEESGIVVCKEILGGINSLVLVLVSAFKDGIQLADVPVVISSILADEKIKCLFTDLFTKISEIKSELSELDSQEIVELVVMEAAFVPEIIKALKK